MYSVEISCTVTKETLTIVLAHYQKIMSQLATSSEWTSDCCLTLTQQFLQLYHGKNKLIFKEMMMRSTLY
jgi:hypothetical protein